MVNSKVERQRASFLSANLPTLSTNAVIRLGSYEWKVHSGVFAKASTFFRALFEGGFKESDTMTVELHEDDPFILARAILFTYDPDWDYKSKWHSSEPTERQYEGMLQSMMSHHDNLSEFAVDTARDKARTEAEIQCLLVRLADKYDMPGLLTAAWGRLELSDSTFWLYHDWLGEDVIDRNPELQSTFAHFLVRNHNMIAMDERLKQWLRNGSMFSVKVVEICCGSCCTHRMPFNNDIDRDTDWGRSSNAW